MRRSLANALLALAMTAALASAEDVVLHVAPDGRDDWSGRVARTAADGSDGPLATLVGARDAIRSLKEGGDLTGAVHVQIQPGFYRMNETLRLTPEDSGTAEAPITYESSPGTDPLDAPVVSGGVALTGWKVEDGAWTTTLPESVGDVRHLYVSAGGGRFVRRYRPMVGVLGTAGLTDSPIKPGASMQHVRSQKDFVYREGDLGPWALESGVELVALHDWSASRMRIAAIDADRRVVTLTDYPHYRIGHWYGEDRNPYFLENVGHAFGAPGVFFVDPESRELRYTPTAEEAGLDPASGDVRIVAPVHERLLILNGDPEAGRFVEHLRFRGLVFAFTGFDLPADGYKEGQGMTTLPAAVEATGARDCRWERSAFEHLGGYAIRLDAGCSDDAVAGCTMHDLGGGGVLIGVKDRNAGPPILPTGNVVEDCRIVGLGRDHYSAHGVWVGIAAGTTVRHNEIADGLYSTVSVGWCWDDGPSSVRENVVEANHIHDAMRLLADGGGIYTLGRQPGTALSENHIHDIHRSRFAGRAQNNGIFFDEGTRDLLVERNAIHDVANDLIRFNRSQKDWQTFVDNAFGVATDDPAFPSSVADAAGPPSPAWRPAPPAVDPPILAMPLPEDSEEDTSR